ncbi:restriction endonuclease [Streptomyces sp. CS014]|uniref:restriction endonuclease n=1 Tax=Streptomyces sp. CS014 TaxID=2162707 RepID=UPI0013A5BA92|nr:restriction endonuclease [Streptomyces sp. CS014]
MQEIRKEAAYRTPLGIPVGNTGPACGGRTPGDLYPCLLPYHRKRGCPLHGWGLESYECHALDERTGDLVKRDGNRYEKAVGELLLANREITFRAEQQQLLLSQGFPYAQVDAEKLWWKDWEYLEHITGRYLDLEGCALVQGGGRSGDGGIDVAALTPGNRLVAVQCKHYADGVGPAALKTFHYDTTEGWEDTPLWRKQNMPRPKHRVFITTGGFEGSARRVAENTGIHLVDGTRLLLWAGAGVVLRQILGVSERSW